MTPRTPLTAAAVALAASSLAACGSSSTTSADKPTASPTTRHSTSPSPVPTPTKTPTKTTKPSPTKPAIDWDARIATFEREDLGGIKQFDWGSDVTKVTYLGGGLLKIETDIVPDSDAKPAAEPMCNAFSTIGMDYPEITTVEVASSEHGTITSCSTGN